MSVLGTSMFRELRLRSQPATFGHSGLFFSKNVPLLANGWLQSYQPLVGTKKFTGAILALTFLIFDACR